MPADQLTRAKTAARRAQVITAAAAGFTPAQIAQNVPGVTSARMAAQDLRRGLADAQVLRALPRPLLVELELQQLAAAQRAVEGVLRRSAANEGKGDQMVLAAAGRLMQIADRRHRLEGLDVPAQAPRKDELAARRERLRQRRANG